MSFLHAVLQSFQLCPVQDTSEQICHTNSDSSSSDPTISVDRIVLVKQPVSPKENVPRAAAENRTSCSRKPVDHPTIAVFLEFFLRRSGVAIGVAGGHPHGESVRVRAVHVCALHLVKRGASASKGPATK